jgi:hypothetical protein
LKEALMAITSTTTIRHTIDRVKQAWTEMDHAQRRLFEIRTGIPTTGHAGRATLDELEALYKLDSSRASG